MSRFGLVGGSYTLPNVNADAQRCVNQYVEHDESGAGKSEFQLCPTPGLTLFSVLATGPLRGHINANKRFFAVGGDTLYEVFNDGTNQAIGNVGNDGNPVSMCNSATQLAVVSNGQLYGYNLSTNAWLGAIATGLGPVKMVGYDDAYFVCLISNSQKFQISALLDVTTWDPTDVTQVSLFPDEILSMIVDHREIILHGVTKSCVYGNTGAADFPFSPIPSAYIEMGIAAPWCRDRIDNSEMWLGADDRGRLIANRLQGYAPIRVSNHAVESEWQSYTTVEDAVSYSYQENGHTFWQLNFPTQQKTWDFDVATGMWHERSFLNPATGQDEAHLSICHTFVFGQHMVGDRRNGNVYVMKSTLTDDDGQPIKRVRRAPHISVENEWMFHNSLQLDAECGLNTTPSQLDGITTSLVPIGGGANVPIGDLGALDIVAMAILSDGSRLISPIFVNVDNEPSRQVRLNLPPVENIISWRFFYCPTGQGDGPCYYTTLPVISATAGYTYSPAAGGFFYLGPDLLPVAPVTLNWVVGISGYDADGNGIPRNPIVWLSYSNDGGHTWSNDIEMNLGPPGQYAYRCIARRLGRARDRVYQITYSDTAPLRIVDAYLKATGYGVTPRLADRMRQQA